MKFKTIKYKGKEFRIYKWENKKFGDFPMPKGFDWAGHKDFIGLCNKNLVKLEKHPIEYYVKNYSNKNIKKEWKLSKVYLYWGDYLYSGDDDFAVSGNYGRGVISRRMK